MLLKCMRTCTAEPRPAAGNKRVHTCVYAAGSVTAAFLSAHSLHAAAVPAAHQDALYVLVWHAAVWHYLYQLLLREKLKL
jgi:hypothetical protein